MGVSIRQDDLKGEGIRKLLERHLKHAALHSPAMSRHALDVAGLQAPDVTFWTAWEHRTLVGCGALRELDPRHGEIKSMHTAERFRGRGIGTFILGHLASEARRRGYHQLSLETGSMPGFAAARALYAGAGFQLSAPFADYREDANSVFMTLDLRASRHTAADPAGVPC